MPLGPQEIEHRFGFHKATVEGDNATLPKHRDMRLNFRSFAELLDELLPDGREKSLAFTALQEASMWTHCAIAMQAPVIDETPQTGLVAPLPQDGALGVSAQDSSAVDESDLGPLPDSLPDVGELPEEEFLPEASQSPYLDTDPDVDEEVN